MQIIATVKELKQFVSTAKINAQTIGFVPTMGALHEGHLALVKQAKSACDIVVCSIFVNPTQFNNAHDLAVYPRTLETDSALLQSVACDIVFAPSVAEMYPNPTQLKFDFGDLEHVLEGEFRPGHFNGVGLVVSKLFHMVAPDKAFFGQKDLQQCAVVKRLVDDLSFPLDLIICPTQRAEDGLALSSRNKNLTESQRNSAPVIYQCLSNAKERLLAGESFSSIKSEMIAQINAQPEMNVEYFELVHRDSLQIINVVEINSSAICVASFCGKTRLIDNILI